MTSLSEPAASAAEQALRASVERRFAVRAAEDPPTPAWPDPWPDGETPDDAFDRISRPERLEIVVRRADAWIDALIESGLLESVADVDPPAWSDGVWLSPDHDIRARMLRPVAVGATPLTLVTYRWQTPVVQSVMLVVGAGEPAVMVDEPDCFCDACDAGSENLLEWYDEQILEVVGGDFCFVDAPGITIRDGRSGRRSIAVGQGARWTRDDADRAISDARAGTSAHPFLVADVPWWSR